VRVLAADAEAAAAEEQLAIATAAMSLLHFLVCSCLLVAAYAAIPESFVALPPELGSKAPARLVFSVAGKSSRSWSHLVL
jgi:hypothetical protein